MNLNDLENIESSFNSYYQNKLKGRWIQLHDILPLIENLSTTFRISKIGNSYNRKDIFSISYGSGKIKVLIWSQMHGNESTGTKAIFDLFCFFEDINRFKNIKDSILKNCTLVFIPMLNPDGAAQYTRMNAQNIDLNRDVIDKKALESVILQKVLKKTNPKYCFNLHDQRTIFSIGNENKPATLSFLAPSEDKIRSITAGRMETMKIIVSIKNSLQKFIPDQIGRYSDAYYPTATGDNFQKMGHNTILIESGHFQDDYQREETRKYTFLSLLQGIYTISNAPNTQNFKDYFNIPNNKKNYLDIIIKNVTYKKKIVDLGILFKEKVENSKLLFIPAIEKIENLDNFNANLILDKSHLNFTEKKDIDEWVKNDLF